MSSPTQRSFRRPEMSEKGTKGTKGEKGGSSKVGEF